MTKTLKLEFEIETCSDCPYHHFSVCRNPVLGNDFLPTSPSTLHPKCPLQDVKKNDVLYFYKSANKEIEIYQCEEDDLVGIAITQENKMVDIFVSKSEIITALNGGINADTRA